MHALYLVSVFLHVLAATTWLGGMLFLVLVVVTWLRAGGASGSAGSFLRETGTRFRAVGWACFGVLLPTGVFQLFVRGVRLTSFVDPTFLGSAAGKVLVAKLALVALVILLSAVHDFGVGPAATTAIAEAPGSTRAERLRRRASLLGRANALLALVIVALAVMIVRGVPS